MPTDFSHSSSRKARFKALFNQYEDEISRLIKQIDALNNEITELKVFLEKVIIIYFNNWILKDPSRFNNKYNDSLNVAESPRKDMIQLLKIKLEQLQLTNDEVRREHERLKEVIVSNLKELNIKYSLVILVKQETRKRKFNIITRNSKIKDFN